MNSSGNSTANQDLPATDNLNIPVRLHVTLHSLAFITGLTLVFVALGFSAGLVSDFLFNYGDLVRVIAGVFLVFFGLLMLHLIPIPFLQRDLRAHLTNKPSGYAGSALVGVAFGAGWTPCIGPILGGILFIAANGSAAQGSLLLFVYSIGFAVPFLIAAQALTAFRRLNRYVGIIEKAGGVMLIIVGVLLLSNAVSALSPYLASLGSLEGILGEGFYVAKGESVPLTFYPLAVLAGALSFLSPCVLPILPSFMAYLTGVSADKLMRT